MGAQVNKCEEKIKKLEKRVKDLERQRERGGRGGQRKRGVRKEP